MTNKEIRSIFIGNLALTNEGVYSLKNYARFYNELAARERRHLHVMAGYLLPGELGYDFACEEKIDSSIRTSLCRGNTPATSLLPFVWRNIAITAKATVFSLSNSDYFVFLPSPIGAWSTFVISLFNRHRSMGIYIGGYYGREQAYERRKGIVKKTIKRISAYMVDKLVERAIHNSDYVITSSYEYYNRFRSSGKIFLTPPLINVDEKDLDLQFQKGPEKVITYCGELRHAKGVIDLIEAFALIARRHSTCRLRIIGSGQAELEMKRMASEQGIGDKVDFLGQIKCAAKLKEALGTSEIFVLPSYSEGFPRVAYECFTLGVPSILTPVGGIPYLVKDQEHCLLVAPGDVNALVLKIDMLLKNHELAQTLVRNAKTLMRESVFPRIATEKSLATMIDKRI